MHYDTDTATMQGKTTNFENKNPKLSQNKYFSLGK